MLEYPERLTGISGPLQHRLSPEHPHAVVHPSVLQVRTLCRVPEIAASTSLLQFLAGVEHRPGIGLACPQLLPSPHRDGVSRSMPGIVVDKVVREFAPHQKFVL